jgi:hypothetical protein
MIKASYTSFRYSNDIAFPNRSYLFRRPDNFTGNLIFKNHNAKIFRLFLLKKRRVTQKNITAFNGSPSYDSLLNATLVLKFHQILIKQALC